MNANFLAGPVTVRPEVLLAFAAPPLSHRQPAFIDMMRRTRSGLTTLANASHVTLMLGSGTLANDAVAAQLAKTEGSGLILSNGEFGERLVDHARRSGLRFALEWQRWGEAFDWDKVRALADQCRPRWIWAVLTETSTGVANPLHELRGLGERTGADLCLDAISAIGLMPVDLRGVRFATAVSGKGLAAFPGLAAVFHDGRLARARRIPRYVDLCEYEAADNVPFTHSSNLVAALESSLAVTRWREKFELVHGRSRALREALRRVSLPPLAREEECAPGIITVKIPDDVRAGDVALALETQGFEIAHQSRYLQERNWVQIALMGEPEAAAEQALPAAMDLQIARLRCRPPIAKPTHIGPLTIR